MTTSSGAAPATESAHSPATQKVLGPPPTGGGPAGRGARFGALLVGALSLLLYLPSLRYDLVFDDAFLIAPERNLSMRGVADDLTKAFALWTQEYWDGVNPDQIQGLKSRGQALYRPLTTFLWALIQNVYGWHGFAKAWPYHLINVLLNLWVVLLLHRFVGRLFGSPRLALTAALLFAAHPLHVEAVTYVAGLSDLLAAATVFLGCNLWLSAIADRGKLGSKAFLGLLSTLAVGLFAKESAVLLLAAIALTDVLLTLRRQGPSRAQRLAVYGGLLLVVAGHLALRWSVMGYLQPNLASIGRLDNVLIGEPFEIRALNAFRLLAKSVWLVLWPIDLSVDYSYRAIEVTRSWLDPEPLAGVILIGSLLLVGLVRLRRQPALAWGLLFFVGTALYTSNLLLPIGTIFGERLLYLPTAGASLALAVVFDRLFGASGKAAAPGPVGLLLLVLAAGALAQRTWLRNADFKTSLELFEAAARVVPESGKVHYQLGALYAGNRLFDKATEHFETALKCDDTFIQAAIQLGDVHASKQVWDKALAAYDGILAGIDTGASQIVGDPSQTASVRSMVLSRRARAKQQMGDLEGAAADLAKAGELQAEGAEAQIALATLLHGQGKWAESIPVLRQALRLEPGNINLLLMLARAGTQVQDLETYRESLRGLEATEEGIPFALAMRAEVFYENASAARDPVLRERAVQMFDEVIRRTDKLATPYYYRGRFLVETSRAFYEGIVQYDRALEIDPRCAPALLYKALAQANLGQHEEALATLKILQTVNPNGAVFALIGECHFWLGNLEAMERAYEKARELGTEPVEAIVQRAQGLRQVGQLEKALAVLDQALVSSTYAQDADPWKTQGLLYLELGRPAEALTSFEQQRLVLDGDLKQARDPWVDVNRARCLAALGREDEAAAALVVAETALIDMLQGSTLWNSLRSSILHRRAELHLRPGGAYWDPAAAEALCAEGLRLTPQPLPMFLELSVEARLVSGDLAGAIDRARQAAEALRRAEDKARLTTAAELLEQAAAGDVLGAAAALREKGEPFFTRLADVLER